MFSIRWHGRGGQGVWTASDILARVAIDGGRYAQSFPEFGPERMGAPVTAFTRINEKPITLHCAVYEPDSVVVLDSTLLGIVDVCKGLKGQGTIVLNTKEEPEDVRRRLGLKDIVVWTVPATDIAVSILGIPVTNTAMLGALVKATGIVDLQSMIQGVVRRFPGKIGELNRKVVERSYSEVKG